jgi:phosphate starvation-inducible membrane PsiE
MRTHREKIEHFLIFIAMTALSRLLVIAVQHASSPFHLHLLLSLSITIAMLSAAALILADTAEKYGRPDNPWQAVAHSRILPE